MKEPEITTAQIADKTIRNSIWVYATTYSGKILVFISTLILARLLSKEAYGIAGYALIFISFLDVLHGLGIQSALIYEKRTDERLVTAFWTTLVIATLLFGLSWILAPFVGAFFRDEAAIPVVRVLSLTFPISALSMVHDTILRKELNFKRRFIPELAHTTAKGVVSIVLAFYGWGAWSLIIGQLAGVTFAGLSLWRIVPWRPRFAFYPPLLPSLLHYGMRIVLIDGLGSLLLNSDYLLIGRYLGAASLGVYTLAFRIPELLIKQFSDMLGKVLFPAYARIQQEGLDLKSGFLVTLQYVNLVTIPLGLGLAITAEPFVYAFFSEKWVEAIPVIQAISIYTLLRAALFNIGDLYKAQGRTNLMVKIKFWQTVMTIPVLYWVVTNGYSITAVAWSQTILVLIASVVKLKIMEVVLNITMREMWAAFKPSALSGLGMSVVVYLLRQSILDWSPFLQLIVLALVGVLVYISLVWYQEKELLQTSWHTIRRLMIKKGKKTV